MKCGVMDINFPHNHGDPTTAHFISADLWNLPNLIAKEHKKMRVLFGCCLIWLAIQCKALPKEGDRVPHPVPPPAALNSCRHELEYPSADLCCLNCPAGQHLLVPCSRDGEDSVCAPCPWGSYTEHSNHLHQCLPCAKCHPDQEVVEACLPTQNTRCQCRPGTFCSHDDACEVCQRCRSCRDGERMVKNCTVHSNRECSKRATSTPVTEGPSAGIIAGILVPVFFLVIAAMLILAYKTKRSCIKCVPVSSQSLQEVAVQGSPMVWGTAQTEFLPPHKSPWRDGSVTDDDPGLGSSNSESSLFIQNRSESSARASPEITSWTRSGTPFATYVRDDDQLFPIKGEESLKSCFQYFDELDCRYLKRFFRNLGISDNAIRYALQQEPTDAAYGLLVKWLEKTGKEASLNHLLQKLRDLDQNLLAEEIIEKAVSDGHYERRTPNVGGEE